jgi:hypothetical protein
MKGVTRMPEDTTVRVHFIDDTERIVPAKDIRHVGEEGARRATAMVDGREIPIYNRPDWPDPWLWEEQEAAPVREPDNIWYQDDWE